MEPGSRYPFGGEVVVIERRWNFYVRDVARVVARTLRAAGCEADVVLTDDRTVRRLNCRDRGKNKPTNVLTYEQPPEILLALGVVRREAAREGKAVRAHLVHLLVHGALHLQGYDHHHAGEAREMESEETKILARLRVANPWKNR
ncbi:rRNA maturation RNase YbeY [Acidocella sp.]|uniref:rRNA maturation RNase YbeY n=1 Tax=Acidocella sp. TaxID=50710 RepID=UPI0017A01643|nr:rRNA maturation RNase YbeY [Acidocella sp.]NNM58074.1 rRNA maturation RNase YbeY [Acidocella sp.]